MLSTQIDPTDYYHHSPELEDDETLAGCRKYSAEGYEWSLKRVIASLAEKPLNGKRCEFSLNKVYAGRITLKRNPDNDSYNVVGTFQSKLGSRSKFITILTIIDYGTKEILLQQKKSFLVGGNGCSTCKFAGNDFIVENASASYKLFVTIKRSAISSDQLVNLITEQRDPRSKQIEAKLKILENVERLLANEKLCDVKLVTRDKRELYAHRVILAARSSVFAAMFDSDMRERSESVVEIDDIDHEVLRSLLDYLYTGEVASMERLAVEMIHAADKYDVGELKRECEEYVCRSFPKNRAIEILAVADSYGCERLKGLAADVFLRDPMTYVDKEAFKGLRKGHAGLLEFLLLRLLKM